MCKSWTACLKSNRVWSSRYRAFSSSCCSKTSNNGTKCNFRIPTRSHQFCKTQAASCSRCRRSWFSIHSSSSILKFSSCCMTWEHAASCFSWIAANECFAWASSCCRNATFKSARNLESAMPKLAKQRRGGSAGTHKVIAYILWKPCTASNRKEPQTLIINHLGAFPPPKPLVHIACMHAFQFCTRQRASHPEPWLSAIQVM